MPDIRKIIHIDMDAFFASIEQRERPELKGKPVIVGGSPDTRGVVATCSYEARKYGIHSAMPSSTAYQLCPSAIFIKPRLELYKKVSGEIMDIFFEYTDLVEPISFDEAYLDVTVNKKELPYATAIAREIKARILEKTRLTASAGVSFNKFLAKLASAYKKPDGFTVVTPEVADKFIDKIPVSKFFGVGKVTQEYLAKIGVFTGADLKKFSEEELVGLLKERGRILYKNAHCEDDRPVNPDRKRKSLGKEITLSADISDKARMVEILGEVAARIEESICKFNISGKSITLKVKYSDFKVVTRCVTCTDEVKNAAEIMAQTLPLLDKVDLSGKKVRLLGIYLSSLSGEISDRGQGDLFGQ